MCMWCLDAYSPVSCVTAPSDCVSCAATTSRRARCWMEVAAMTGLDTLMTVSDQVMLLPDQYLRQGITILRSVIHLARLEEEGRREQALLVRQALEGNEAAAPRSAAVTEVRQHGWQTHEGADAAYRKSCPALLLGLAR